MKHITLKKFLAAGVAGALALGSALAQTSSTTTTTSAGGVSESTTTTSTMNGSGVISAYTPGSDYVTFRSESRTAAPARYYYTKKTVLVDPEGRAVEWSTLRPDMPVTYTYVREGDRMVVTKVTVNKPVVVEKETTTTTTTTRP